MPKVTYKSEVLNRDGDQKTGVDTFTGTVAIFQIGSMRIRFAIQDKKGAFGEHSLIHLASGRVAVSARTLKAKRSHVFVTTGKSVLTREAIRLCLQDTCKRVGEAKVLSTILAAPVINPEHA